MSVSNNLLTLQDTSLVSKVALGPDAEVLSFALRKYSDEKLGFLGSHHHLTIRLRNQQSTDGDAETVEVVCFVKAIPYEVPLQMTYVSETGIFSKEGNFFRKIAPLMTEGYGGPAWAPRCFLVKHDALVFEDLGLRGFGMREKLFNEEVIQSGLTALASLHASSMRAEEKLSRRFTEVYPEDFYEVAFVREPPRRQWFLAGVAAAVRIAEEMHLDASRLPATFEHTYAAVKPSRSKVNVVSHGDLWANNLLFDDQSPPQCRLVDFQLFRYSPVGHDLAQFLYLCASRSLRERKETELLRYYFRRLKEFAGGCTRLPTWDEVLLGYEEQRVAACCTAALYFPTVLLDGNRGAELMKDSESYGAFCFEDRREAVLENMRLDACYDQRLRETIGELVEMSFNIEQYPSPS